MLPSRLGKRYCAHSSTRRRPWMKLPKEPPLGLLMSMALRSDHGLGVPGYYDQLGIDHNKRLKSTLATMRQIYEEVSGHGFYTPEREEEYKAMAIMEPPLL